MGESAIERGQDSYFEVKKYFYDLIDLIFKSQIDKKDGEFHFYKENTNNKTQLKDIVQLYIHKNYMRTITHKTISDALHISVSKLSHTYSKETGETPLQTLTNHRISISKQMVKDGYTFQQISDSCGFCSPYHFSKVFKKISKITPRDYRAMQ